MAVEFIGGWLSGSIALISDAVHMLSQACLPPSYIRTFASGSCCSFCLRFLQ
ncbi:MAG: hypothetical protein ACYST5_21975 [Planctomycetota bacterium]